MREPTPGKWKLLFFLRQKLEPVKEPEPAKEPDTSQAAECPKEISDQIMNDVIKQYAGKVISYYNNPKT